MDYDYLQAFRYLTLKNLELSNATSTQTTLGTGACSTSCGYFNFPDLSGVVSKHLPLFVMS